MEDLTDVGSIIEDFASAYVVTRAGALDMDSDPGRPTQGTPTTLNITACIQPPETVDLMRMPEGLRTEQTRIVYTATELLAPPDVSMPDLIAAEGLMWQVESVAPWDVLGGYFYAVIRKVGSP